MPDVRFTILQVTESWAGPGNEANLTPLSLVSEPGPDRVWF